MCSSKLLCSLFFIRMLKLSFASPIGSGISMRRKYISEAEMNPVPFVSYADHLFIIPSRTSGAITASFYLKVSMNPSITRARKRFITMYRRKKTAIIKKGKLRIVEHPFMPS